MRLVISLTLVLFCLTGFSQKEPIKTIFKKPAHKETVKIILNMSEYDASTITLFKEKLLTYKQKIEIVHYDDTSALLTIVYNEYMLKEDFINVFNNYQIDYITKSKKKIKPTHQSQ